ncbi:hypothetical protein PybrP1_003359 [[Pythium] brassicae (nom. inval.)]|nr:hypothetical protein PybrP1_003359 [[Pythium] brassicae (nom. inval.)]
MSAAVKLGKLEFVKFLYELDPESCTHDEGYLTADAAEGGFLEIVKFFHECGGPKLFDWRAMHGAAVNGHLDVIKFLHENRDEGCRYFTLVYAYENGHHHVLDFLCEYRPMEQAKRQAGWERQKGRPGLADKIERGAAAAKRAKRKVYPFQ